MLNQRKHGCIKVFKSPFNQTIKRMRIAYNHWKLALFLRPSRNWWTLPGAIPLFCWFYCSLPFHRILCWPDPAKYTTFYASKSSLCANERILSAQTKKDKLGDRRKDTRIRINLRCVHHTGRLRTFQSYSGGKMLIMLNVFRLCLETFNLERSMPDMVVYTLRWF